MTHPKEAPMVVPSFGRLLIEVNNEERIQMESVARAIKEKLMIGKLVANWCSKCGHWRLQFVSLERIKSVSSNETYLCTKCSTPIKLILDSTHVLLSS